MSYKTILTALLLTCSVATFAKNYYVAPNGKDKAKGTMKAPFATFGKAQSLAQAGDTVFFRQGTYHVKESEIQNMTQDKRYAAVYHITRSGSEGKPIVYTGYGDERAVFDFSNVKPAGRRVTAFLLCADYIVMRQIEVVGMQVTIVGHTQSECVRMEPASHCRLENMSFHDGMGIGVYILGGKDNLVINCDAYNNFDSISDNGYGGNVDGFGAHLTSAEYTGNVFRNCRAWWNSDDGFDLINCLAPVKIENCVAFYNGYRPNSFERAGDGTGVKAGGFGMQPMSKMVRKIVKSPRHEVSNCIAYRNKNKGIYANHHIGGVTFRNNVSIGNPKNFTMLCRKSAEENVDIPGRDHMLIGNVSLRPTMPGEDYTDCDAEHCTMMGNVTEQTMKKGETAYFDIEKFNPDNYLKPRAADGKPNWPQVPNAPRARGSRVRTNVPLESIQLSDPFVLADSATQMYYMTGTGGMMWKSKDLKLWEGPYNVVETDPQSWMGPRPMIWAAEIHQYKGKYYYFATFTNRDVIIDEYRGNKIERRASHVLVSDKPDGPYRPMTDPMYLPADRPTLDGTFWVDTDGKPYMVYCWEWLQNWDGTIEKIELKPDLSGSVGEGKLLFRASASPWSREIENGKERPNKVTDGPFLFRTTTGRLGMIWTSWRFDEYTQGVAYSDNGTLDGNWIQQAEPITPPNYGHGMIFKDLQGNLLLSCHSHASVNGRTIRIPRFFKVSLTGDKLTVEK